jgi:hypothetical protein
MVKRSDQFLGNFPHGRKKKMCRAAARAVEIATCDTGRICVRQHSETGPRTCADFTTVAQVPESIGKKRQCSDDFRISDSAGPAIATKLGWGCPVRGQSAVFHL